MAKRAVRKRGRSWLALALVVFVLAAVVIVWRRVAGVEAERALEELAEQRRTLEAERARLESQIREAESLGRIAPIARGRLGMHVATDSHYVLLPRPSEER
jgi:cell division protein FtsL